MTGQRPGPGSMFTMIRKDASVRGLDVEFEFEMLQVVLGSGNIRRGICAPVGLWFPGHSFWARGGSAATGRQAGGNRGPNRLRPLHMLQRPEWLRRIFAVRQAVSMSCRTRVPDLANACD